MKINETSTDMKTRQIFMVAATAAMLAACTKGEVIYDDSDVAIAFSPVAQMSTKAPVYGPMNEGDGTSYNTSESFGVTALHKVTDEDSWDDFKNGGGMVLYIDNGKFVNRPNGNTWGGETPYYWPKTGLLAFAGFSPYDSLNDYVVIDDSPNVKFDNFVQGTYDYSDGNLTNETIDAMWFDFDDQNPCNLGSAAQASAGVPVKFKHACSWIDFTMKRDGTITNQDVYFVIEKVELTNVYTKGTFNSKSTSFSTTGDPAVTTPGDETTPWTGHDELTTITLYEKPATDEGYDLTHISGSQLEMHDMIAIPQQINSANSQRSADIQLVITYKQYPVAAGATPNSETVTKSLTAETNAQHWLYGRHYVYNITMGVDEILIAPSVVDWVDEEKTINN